MSKNRKSGKKNREKLNGFFAVLQTELESIYGRTEPIRFARDRLVQRMRKRARISDPTLRSKALDKFLASNARCKTHPLSLDPDVEANARHFIAVVLERFATRNGSEAPQTSLEYSWLFDRWRYGPGSGNASVPGTHVAVKMSKVMTCTAPCQPLVAQLRANHPYWSAEDAKTGSGYAVVGGSLLDFVLKNEEQLRTIAKEPEGNMCLQLAAGSVLEDCLRMIGLDITTQQPKNQDFARRGSMTGEFATLDLSSASDMIQTELVRRLWPRDWYYLLLRLRSQSIRYVDHDKVERDEPLYMISTMGNGFTFPLMTLTIVALIYGYRATCGGPDLWVDWKRTAVYGDDIIIPTNEYDLCVKTLESAGLVVNRDKSYCEGPFRESCGGDYYEGVDVTPFYVKSLGSDQEVYVAMNQVLEWCGKLQLLLPRTLRHLRAMLIGGPFFVPEWHNPDEGILVPNGKRRYTYLSKKSAETALRDERFAMSLALGGYISETAPGWFNGKPCPALRGGRKDKSTWERAKVYVTREAKTKYRAQDGRIPKGFLDGWDPLTRSRASSQHIGLIAHVCLM